MSIIRVFNILLIGCYALISEGQSSIEIRINLGGYPTTMPKKALVLSKSSLDNPILILINNNGIVEGEYRGVRMEQAWYPFSDYYNFDFSGFQKKGTYYLELKGTKIVSQSFPIGIYPNWQEDVVAFIRSQRCGFNPYIREFCHQRDGLSFFGIRPDSTRIDATGGWHDAIKISYHGQQYHGQDAYGLSNES